MDFGVYRYNILKTVDSKRDLVLVRRIFDGRCAVIKRKWLRNLSEHSADADVYVPSSRPARIRLELFVDWYEEGMI